MVQFEVLSGWLTYSKSKKVLFHIKYQVVAHECS